MATAKITDSTHAKISFAVAIIFSFGAYGGISETKDWPPAFHIQYSLQITDNHTVACLHIHPMTEGLDKISEFDYSY
jgi:hypothetical protein